MRSRLSSHHQQAATASPCIRGTVKETARMNRTTEVAINSLDAPGDKATFSQQVSLAAMDFNGEVLFRNMLDHPEVSHRRILDNPDCRHLQEKEQCY